MKVYGAEKDAVISAMESGEITIALYGLGRMGLPLAGIFADCGARVLGVDINPEVVASVNRGDIDVIGEPGLQELVRENVVAGRLQAVTDFVDAAKNADAHDFISNLPQGYDTKVGDRGVRLSGGQLQRITFSRALIGEPSIIILDEATNAIDCISERLIKETLEKLKLKCTIIIIAHRLSTIEHADHIIVLKNGLLSEQGSYKDLLRINGHFAKLYRVQYKNESVYCSCFPCPC